MDNERANQLHAMLKEFRNTVDGQLDKKLDLEKCSRIIEKLGTFATECEECTQHLFDLENHFTQLKGHSKLGTSLGIVFGLLFFDNLALGIPIGCAIGVAIGAALDANANSKGMVL